MNKRIVMLEIRPSDGGNCYFVNLTDEEMKRMGIELDDIIDKDEVKGLSIEKHVFAGQNKHGRNKR